MVFVLDKSKKPLDMISHAKARILLKNKQAVVHKIYPFTIRLKENSVVSKAVFCRFRLKTKPIFSP